MQTALVSSTCIGKWTAVLCHYYFSGLQTILVHRSANCFDLMLTTQLIGSAVMSQQGEFITSKL